jgi:hypothetical protein
MNRLLQGDGTSDSWISLKMEATKALGAQVIKTFKYQLLRHKLILKIIFSDVNY